MSPEERAAKREAAIQGMVAKGYTRERAEELIDMVATALFKPGGRFADPSPDTAADRSPTGQKEAE